MNKIIAEFNMKIKSVSDFAALTDENDKKLKILKMEFTDKLEAIDKNFTERKKVLMDQIIQVKDLTSGKIQMKEKEMDSNYKASIEKF